MRSSQKLARAYSTLGAAGNLGSFESPLPHALSYPMRLAVYNWFERHLKHSDRDIQEEPPTSPEKDETLWCGATGNTVRDFGGKTPFLLTRERARGIRTPDRPGGPARAARHGSAGCGCAPGSARPPRRIATARFWR